MTQFNERSDRAAQALKQSLIGQGATIEPTVQVEVGPDGQRQPDLPPEGSYARNMLEREQAAEQLEQQHQAREQAQQIPDQTAPLQQPPQPEQPAEQELSANAQRRITELTQMLREKDQELVQARDVTKSSGESTQALQKKVQEIEEAYNALVTRNLDALDPDERASVLAEAKAREMVGSLRNELMGQLGPELQVIRQQRAEAELRSVASSYPRFDPAKYGPAIVSFRQQNPNCTIEQAFRAVAEPQDLVTQAPSTASAVPPVVPPNAGGMPRYLPESHQQRGQQQQRTPEDEIREELEMASRLRSSDDPAEQLRGLKMIEQNIARRLRL